MKTETIVILAALGGLAAWVLLSGQGRAMLDPKAAEQARFREIVGTLPAELTWRERSNVGDRTLGQNVGKYAMEGSVGGYYGAAGGAVVGAFVELFD